MNIISFILAVLSIIVFVCAWQGAPRAHLGLGLALFVSALVLQFIWVTTATVRFG